MTNRGSAGVRWTACALGLAVRRQRWGGGATLTTQSATMAHLLGCQLLDEPCSPKAIAPPPPAPKTSSSSQRGQRRAPGCGNINYCVKDTTEEEDGTVKGKRLRGRCTTVDRLTTSLYGQVWEMSSTSRGDRGWLTSFAPKVGFSKNCIIFANYHSVDTF